MIEKQKDLTEILKDLKAEDEVEVEEAEESEPEMDEDLMSEPLDDPWVQQLPYKGLRDSMQTGDIIAFDGKGKFSTAINLVTGKCKNDHHVSHVAIVLKTRAHREGVVMLMESTRLADDFAGVQITRLSSRIKTYKGKIWWYPIRRDIQVRIKPMVKWLLAQEGKPYDLPQAIISTIDFAHQPEDFDKLFCSELAAEALEKGGVIEEVIASRITPVELIDDYFEIYGRPALIV